jgi:nitrogen fixation/metabolism regulation signal transduction histidine kinase
VISQQKRKRVEKIFRRGLFTFGRIVYALLLIARSIAVPLVNLSKAVGASPGELVPIIPVLHRKDGIGDLNRVMREMSRQVQEHFDQVVKSEMFSQYCFLVYGQI